MSQLGILTCRVPDGQKLAAQQNSRPADLRVKLIDFGTVQIEGLQGNCLTHAVEYPVGSADYIAPEYPLGCLNAIHCGSGKC